jgi:hypothetical protein
LAGFLGVLQELRRLGRLRRGAGVRFCHDDLHSYGRGEINRAARRERGGARASRPA